MQATHTADTIHNDTTLRRRIEEASVNAWPAMRQMLLDGWMLRFSKGLGSRTNSVISLYATDAPYTSAHLEEKVRFCENYYAREQQPAAFKITADASAGCHQADLENLLATRGYQRQDQTRMLVRPLGESSEQSSTTRFLPPDQWLNVYSLLTGMQEPARSLHSVVLKSIAGDCGFAALFVANQPVACGLAILDGDLVGLFDIFTAENHRNSGYARTIVADLCHWAAQAGAACAYLQQDLQNQAAERLYGALGFYEAYHYWYRVEA